MKHSYTQLPIMVEAFQMTEERRRDSIDWPNWLNAAWQLDDDELGCVRCWDHPQPAETDFLRINTLEGVLTIQWNDWIIRGIKGELYLCNPDIFEKTYQKKKPYDSHEFLNEMRTRIMDPHNSPSDWVWIGQRLITKVKELETEVERLRGVASLPNNLVRVRSQQVEQANDHLRAELVAQDKRIAELEAENFK